MDGFSNADIAADIDNLASNSLKMKYAFRVPPSRNDDLDILGKPLRQPEGDISLFASLLITEPINRLNDNNNLMVNLLRAVDNLLLLNLRTDDIQPIRKKLPDVLFQKIHILFEFECFLKFRDDLVEGVEVVAVVAASACEVHYC